MIKCIFCRQILVKCLCGEASAWFGALQGIPRTNSDINKAKELVEDRMPPLASVIPISHAYIIHQNRLKSDKPNNK